MELRHYQIAAKEAAYKYLSTNVGNPAIVIPTGGGKTPVIAATCKDVVVNWGGRVLTVAHTKELVQQTANKLMAVCPEVQFGVYSAGLNRKETKAPVIVAGIQSIYKKATSLKAFDLMLIDEVDMVPPDGDGMYRQLISELLVINPKMRIIGYTATPYRLKGGLIFGPDRIINGICYEVGVRDLIDDGFLTDLVTKEGVAQIDTSQVGTSQGEFEKDALARAANDGDIVRQACIEIIEHTRDRRSVLIFATSIEHGQNIVDTLFSMGHCCGFVSSFTLDSTRETLLRRFQSGELKYLCNVNILTVGFDAPAIDCVAMLRPTKSARLYYQMVGRGFRISPGKQNCLVLDFAGNVRRHGPVDTLSMRIKSEEDKKGEAPIKPCPECTAEVSVFAKVCPECGYEFPPSAGLPQEAKHDPKPSGEAVLSNKANFIDEVSEVTHTYYGRHEKNGRVSMRVDYYGSAKHIASEWICLEHEGYAKFKAANWWQLRSNVPVPESVDEALELLTFGQNICKTTQVTVRKTDGKKFTEVVGYVLGPKPEAPKPVDIFADEELPF